MRNVLSGSKILSLSLSLRADPGLELLRSNSSSIPALLRMEAPIALVELSLRFAEAIRKQWVSHMGCGPLSNWLVENWDKFPTAWDSFEIETAATT